MNAESTHWICVTSARRLVIIVGTAMLIEPIITEWVRHPKISDRLIAQGAEGVTRPGAPEVGAPGAVVAWRVGVRGALAIERFSLPES
jgi:hypothetical protein